MFSISDKPFNIYWPSAGLLSLLLLLLAMADIDQQHAAWKSRLDLLSQQQQLEWQRQQAQMGQKLLFEAQSLLMDDALVKQVRQVYLQQQEFPSQDIDAYREQQNRLFDSFDPYWQKLQERGISELNLHFAPGLGVLHMSRPGLLADALGDARPEVSQAFKQTHTSPQFSVSRQGAAYRLLVPLLDNNQPYALIELAIPLEHHSSAAALLHKQIVTILWEQSRQQLHPALVGDWRLEISFEPLASWWRDGLIIAEQQYQLVHTAEGDFLVSWINHSSRRLALLVWSNISHAYRPYQKAVDAVIWKWAILAALLHLVLWWCLRSLHLNRQQLINQFQQQLTEEHHGTEQANARLALALRSSNSGFWEWNIVKNRIRFSPEWRELLKLPPGNDEMDLTDWVNALDPNYRRSHHTDMMNHLKGLTPMFEHEYRVKTGDGGFRWILSRGKVVERDASGRATQVVGVYTDVTDRKSTELISLRQQAALQTLNEITSLPITDVDTQLTRALLLAARYLGVTTAGISDIQKQDYSLRSYIDVREQLKPRLTSLDQTYCSLVVQQNALIAEDNLPASAYRQHPVLLKGGHESYIAAPVVINGALRGTIFFSAPKSRERAYDQLEKDFVSLMAHWAAAVIERCLRDQEKKIIIERFQKLSEHLPGFLYQYQLRPDGTSFYPYASPGIYDVYGVTAEEVSQSAEKIFAVIHPEELGWIAETLSYSASNLTPWVATVRVNNPHRGLLWTHVQSIPEKLNDGSVLWHGYVSDITSLKNAEIKLERANAMHQAILDAASVAMITTDIQGLIKTFNRGAEMMLGYTPEEMIDRQTPAIMHLPDELRERARKLSAELGYAVADGVEVLFAKAKEGEEDENEWTYLRKDKRSLPVLLTVSALRDKFGDITGYLSIARDISELKRIDKMKNEFVSTVSHELRTPLTSISGALGLVANGMVGQLPEAANKMIRIAHNNSLRLINLVNDLLDMEKLLAGKMHFDLREYALMDLIYRSVEANAAYASQFQVKINVIDQCDNARLYVDAERLLQVMANLLSNAAKFSPPESIVEVQCESRFGRVRVTVADQGPGIAEEFRHRIFQKFSQADSSDTRQKGGTGLGLAICKEMIERMGGKIGFDSTPGKGSRFYFEFPCDEQPMSLRYQDDNRSSKIRILVVEDEVDFADYLKVLLESSHYLVDVAHSGNAALEYLELRHYDLVTLDLFLPDMNGIEVLKDIRSRETNREPDAIPMPLVIISVNPDDGKKRLQETGCDNKAIYWVQKPLIEGEPLLSINYALLLAKKLQES